MSYFIEVVRSKLGKDLIVVKIELNHETHLHIARVGHDEDTFEVSKCSKCKIPYDIILSASCLAYLPEYDETYRICAVLGRVGRGGRNYISDLIEFRNMDLVNKWSLFKISHLKVMSYKIEFKNSAIINFIKNYVTI